MRRCAFYFRESLDYVVKINWIAPYLLVPPLLAFLIYVEGTLGAKGLAAFYAPEARLTLSLWNATLLLALITGIKTCLFFSKFHSSRWFRNSLALPVGRLSGFLEPLAAVMVISSGAYVLTMAAILAALSGMGAFPWVAALISSFIPIIWAVCFGAFLGVFTTGGAAAYMFVAVMATSLLTGFPSDPGSASETIAHVLPPLGRSMAGSLVDPSALGYSVLLLIHSLCALLAGALVYFVRSKRR